MWTICNQYSEDVWVAILWFNEDCGEPGVENTAWRTRGWYHITPGSCANVLDEDLDEINRYFYFYADNGSDVSWAGAASVPIPDTRFERCVGQMGEGDVSRGFREIDIGDNDDAILNLTG
jgi:uncharacterized membrane protein